ncbi:MAG: hypothetical protein C5B53_00720 [Candidatus Melainabacteria bacterium]|nr:MAG: hypothetical protein C5B53_00720 [Candidatus Melainabacteria bacterium]
MRISNFGFSSVVAAALIYSALTSANADSVTTTTTTTVDQPGTVVTSPSGTVYLRTASPTVLVKTIETRRANIAKQIDDACARGDITDKQAAALQRELKRIAAESSSTEITYPAAVMLAQDLDLIGTQYRTVVTTAPVYVPIIEGSHFTVVDGQVLELDDLSVRRASLETRITKDLLRGRLTDAQAADLRAKLSIIGAEAAAYQADGSADFKEARRLYTDFDKVASQIDRMAGKEIN